MLILYILHVTNKKLEVDYNIGKLKRDASKIKSRLKVIGKVVVADGDIDIMFPEYYHNAKLVSMGQYVNVYGLIVFITNGYYSVLNIPIFLDLKPHENETVMVDDVPYKLYSFKKGETVIVSTDLIVNDQFMYNEFNMLILQGKVPWYLNDADVSNIHRGAKEFASNNIGDNPVTMELLSSMVFRNGKKKTEQLRYVKGADRNVKPNHVGLKNVSFGLNNNINKITGGYLNGGLTSAINVKATSVSGVEKVLRS